MAERGGEQLGWRDQLVGLNRGVKRVILVAIDFCILASALWASLCFRFNTLYIPPTFEFGAILAIAPVFGILTFWRFGLYRLVTRYMGSSGFRRILLAVCVSVVVWGMAYLMSGIAGPLPRASIIIYAILGTCFVWLSREAIGWVLRGTPYMPARNDSDPSRKGVIIYGAGAVGAQLLEELKRKPEYLPVAFIDENPSLHRQKVNGLKVYPPSQIGTLIQRGSVDEVLLALPDASRQKQHELRKRLEKFRLVVKVMPSMEDIASGRVLVSDLKEISADALLGREPVAPDDKLLAKTVEGQVVMVTGAGGSIGAELARQILRLRPKRLVLFEVSEVALYQINAELQPLQLGLQSANGEPPPEIIALLGSVLDPGTVRRAIERFHVETIFHAAAYKHVPIVEMNPVAGLRNNTIGTQIVAEAARALGVGRMVLISTDKAVRPTNIMGASKRLAELVLQAHAAEPDNKTVFTMVRFGNVLDSSGSVLKLFRKQIQDGGPVTVTDKEVTRFFMSIPEAAELVIQAGALGNGGEVFVLDMGSPVKIDDLARSMIKLMGREVRDEAHPDGDIAIEYTRLREGEKLYEELLIGENTTGTLHPRIMRSWEPSMSAAELQREIEALQAALLIDDIEAIHAVLKRTVEGYTPDLRHLVAGGASAEALPERVRRTLH